MLVNSVTKADLIDDKPWQLNGFASQGVIDADSTFIDEDKDISFDVREIALNGQYQALPRFRVSSQIQYREVGDLDPSDGIELDHLLADWMFYSDGIQELGIRLGRIKNSVGIYNDTRDIPFARPSIILPQSMYSEALRDQYLRLDGGELYGSHLLGGVALSWGLAAGTSDYSEQAIRNITGDLVKGSMKSNDHVRGHIQLSLPNSLDLYASYLDYSYSLEADLNPMLPSRAEIDHWVLGGQWSIDRFEVTAEYSEIDLKMDLPIGIVSGPSVMGIVNGDLAQTSQSYYLQGRYHLDDQWAMFIRYDMLHLDKNDKYGKEPIMDALDIRSGLYSYSKTRSLGVSWQPTADWLLMVEYHYVTGYAWVPPLFEPNSANGQDEDWSMIAGQVAYRFGL